MIEALEYILTGITAIATVVGYVVIVGIITAIGLIKAQKKDSA